jgi:outer membrane protein assembly factor BamB
VKLDEGVWFSPRLLDDQVIVAECPLGDRNIGRGRVDSAHKVTAVCALALADGELRWRNSDIMKPDCQASLKPLTCADGKVFLYTSSYQTRAEDAFIGALDAGTGKLLWRFDSMEGESKKGRKWANTDSASFIVYRDSELIYVGGHGPGGIAIFDADTGKMKVFKPGLRHFAYAGECSMSRGTVSWLIKAAVTWYDEDLNPVSRPASRSQCGSGVFPAQGMVYATPTGCDCTHYARGYLGMGSEPLIAADDEQRRVRGPGKPGPANSKPGDWPMFMANARRSCQTGSALPEKLALKWGVAAAPKPIDGVLLDDRRRDEYWIGALTAPVVAGGVVYAGLPDAHAVVALEAATGKVLWRVPVGGPVDTPPTIFKGLCIFGCQDGCIYALSTADGALAWKFNGALGGRLAMLNGRLTSAHPAPGSVLVADDRVYATVGYHTFLGGIAVWVLDLATGKPLASKQVVGKESGDGVPNLLNDILVEASDGSRWLSFDLRVSRDGELSGRPRHDTSDPVPPIAMTRRVSTVAFTHGRRGGSTHGWASPTFVPSSPIMRAWWMVQDGDNVYYIHGDRHGRIALAGGKMPPARSRPEPAWTLTNHDDFDGLESNTALIKAGDKLIMGGGSYDGAQGVVYVVSTDGKILQKLNLPARVVPGGLAAGGGLIATCVDGSMVAFGAE